MGKLTSWRLPNWYWDQGWQKKDVLDLLRRDWKHRRKVKNARGKNGR